MQFDCQTFTPNIVAMALGNQINNMDYGWIRTKIGIVNQDREKDREREREQQSQGLGDCRPRRNCVKRALEMYKGSYDCGESRSLRGYRR